MTVQRLSSTEFRRRYARIDSPVEVTVLGRVIGTWLPSAIPSNGREEPVRPSLPAGAPAPSGAAEVASGGARPSKTGMEAAYKALRKAQQR